MSLNRPTPQPNIARVWPYNPASEVKEMEKWEVTVMENDFELRRRYKPVIIDNFGGHGEWNIGGLLKAQAEISYKAGEKEERTKIGELLCSFVGNTMLENMKKGKELGKLLNPIIKYCGKSN